MGIIALGRPQYRPARQIYQCLFRQRCDSHEDHNAALPGLFSALRGRSHQNVCQRSHLLNRRQIEPGSGGELPQRGHLPDQQQEQNAGRPFALIQQG